MDPSMASAQELVWDEEDDPVGIPQKDIDEG